jgi:hypothetical protein
MKHDKTPPFRVGFSRRHLSVEAPGDLEASIAPTNSSRPHVSLAADASARLEQPVFPGCHQRIGKTIGKPWENGGFNRKTIGKP